MPTSSNVGSDLSSAVLIVTWVECALGTILICARLLNNLFVVHHMRADFWWALCSYMTGMVAVAFQTVSVHWGFGRHIAELDSEQASRSELYDWIFNTVIITSFTLGKIAIIAFILRIEGISIKPNKKRFLYFIAISTTMVNIAMIVIIWTQCDPVHKTWDNSIPGKCSGRKTVELYGYFHGSYGALVDFILAVYPMIVFWNLQMDIRIKIGLCLLFASGMAAAAASAVKTFELSNITKNSDFTYNVANLAIWASTEMWIILIVSCIPPLRPSFVLIFHKISTAIATIKDNNDGYSSQDEESVVLKSLPRAYTYPRSRKYDAEMARMEEEEEGRDSREDIRPGDRGIMRTTNIDVDYDAP